MRARLGRKLKAYINTLAKKFALRIKRSKADPQTSAHFARLLYSYLEPGAVLPNGTRLTTNQFQVFLRQVERHYNAMPYGKSPSSVRRIWSNPLWAAAERSKGFTLVTDGKRYGAVHPGELLPPGYSEWYVVRRNLSSLEEAQREAASQERSLEMLNGKRSNPRRKPTLRQMERRLRKRHTAILMERGQRDACSWLNLLPFKNDDVLKKHAVVHQRVWNPKKRNPVPSSAPSRALLCIGQLRDLELYDPRTDRTAHIKPKGKWLAWDGKQFQICNVRGQVNATLPSSVVAKHRKFHAANPQGKPFLASMPDRGPTVRDVGLLKSLVYYVPSKIRSPGKNKYLWHHAFGDTGHKGGDSYPIKVMPMLQRDSAGNLFIKRRAGNIFRVDNWLRG